MKVRYLVAFIFDNVSIYKRNKNGFDVLYEGIYSKIPNEFLDMEVRIIGAKGKGIVDIEVI